MNFQESNDYLLSLGNEVSAMKLGLENIRKLLSAVGDPQNTYVKVQVAGTNGKGSVCAFLNSICVSAGIRTGMYTSPHLVSITERIEIDGEGIDEEDFARLATQVRKVSEALAAGGEIENIPTFFEQVTAIGLIAFAEAKVELAILETGLGGRLDATTAANAEIAAITRIDLDHQQYLGETIEEIAAEKAAIIRPDSKHVIIGAQGPEATEVIYSRARKFGIGPMSAHKVQSKTDSQRTFFEPFGEIDFGLKGRHQIENANVAILLVDALNDFFPLKFKTEDVVKGLESARHPGRLERIGRYLLDGAHNPGGAQALREYLDEFVRTPITMIFGSMNDKDVGKIAAILFSRAAQLILTRPSNSRAASLDELLKTVPESLPLATRVFLADKPEAALAKAIEISSENDLILVTGSLYLVGEVKKLLQR